MRLFIGAIAAWAASVVVGAVPAAASTASGEPGGPVEERAVSVQEMLRAGRFRDAYDRVTGGGESADSPALLGLARGVLRAGAKSEDVYQRWAALRAMRTLGEPELAREIRPLATCGDRYVEALALEILARGDPRGNRDLFLAVLDSPYRTVRMRALSGLESALEGSENPFAIGRLATVLAQDEDPELRAFAARVLAVTRSKLAIPALEPALADPSDIVREEAVRSLVALGDGHISARLRQQLAAADPRERLRAARLAALVRDPSLVGALGPLLADGDVEVRMFAARAILSITASEAP